MNNRMWLRQQSKFKTKRTCKRSFTGIWTHPGTAVLIFAFSLLTQITSAQAELDTTKFGQHPRLLLLKGEEVALNRKIAGNVYLKKVHNEILAECDSMLKSYPIERTLIGRRLLSRSREALRRIFFLSYAYRTTGRKKYFKRCEEEMQAIAKFSDWNPSHFLDVAEMSLAMSVGYDWLYNEMSENSRNVIARAIIEKGIDPSLAPAHNGWLRGNNNWNQVCNTGISFAAIAIYEHLPQKSIQLISRAMKSIVIPMKTYAPEGNYAEGYSYWAYGTTFNVLFIDALEKLFGSDHGLSQQPGFLKTAGFYENLVSPAGNCFNYSDCGGRNGLEPAMFWFADRLKQPSLLYEEKKLLDKGLAGAKFNRLLPAFLLWGQNTDMESITSPEEKLWIGDGENPIAIMHTSWRDANSIYVAMKGGTPSAGHAHMDGGSFVMDAEGQRWSADLGMQGYESLESKGLNIWDMSQSSQRWQVFRYMNQAHSTLTVNDALQRVNGKAVIVKSSKDSRFTYAVMDLTSLYQPSISKANRGIAIVDKQYVIVRDEIETGDSACVLRWSMLTPAAVEHSSGNQMQLTNKGKKLSLYVNGAPEAILKTWPTDPPNSWDAVNPNTVIVGYELTIPPHTKKNITVFLVPGEQQLQVRKSSLKPLSDW